MSTPSIDQDYVVEEHQLIHSYYRSFVECVADVMGSLGANRATGSDKMVEKLDDKLNGQIIINPHIEEENRNSVILSNFRICPKLSNIEYVNSNKVAESAEPVDELVELSREGETEMGYETMDRKMSRNIVDNYIFDNEYRGSVISEQTIYSCYGEDPDKKISSQDFGYNSHVLESLIKDMFNRSMLEIRKAGDPMVKYPVNTKMSYRFEVEPNTTLMIRNMKHYLKKECDFKLNLYLDHSIGLKFQSDADVRGAGRLVFDKHDNSKVLVFSSVDKFREFLSGDNPDYPRMIHFDPQMGNATKVAMDWLSNDNNRRIQLTGKRIVEIQDEGRVATETIQHSSS